MKIFNLIVKSINLLALILKLLLTTPLANIFTILVLAQKNIVFSFSKQVALLMHNFKAK